MALSSSDYEKLGLFYLGRPYDVPAKKALDQPLLYASRDLVTHAVVVGMTGSGKTGLGITLLEEAAIDGVPAIVIDPKGDLSNLLLSFPGLSGSEFLPYVNPDDARRAGMELPAWADKVAADWKAGLARWGQDGARIQRLRDAADFAVYTPGGSAGRPVSVLSRFAPPPEGLDAELRRQQLSSTASSILALLAIEADPLKSREHILLSNLLSSAWDKGLSLDLPGLIQAIQTPPFTKIGVLDLESFYPAKERFQLVLALNNLLASPGFSIWMEGEPLDIASFLHTPAGKPRVSIFSIAHLGDAERMFFVTLLLNQLVAWMRTQSGTTSLRAMLMMDEIFGYFPPVAAPPSKLPLLTLLKQARAFGLGVVLATQNPVDLDYKGLANAGTWFVGRLQTERDKARLLDGLEGTVAGTGSGWNKQKLGEILSSLSERVFLMSDVHQDHPSTFETRWALSYLRGPLGREELKALSGPRSEPSKVHAAPVSAPRLAAASSALRPPLPPEIAQVFLPSESGPPEAAMTLAYRPKLLVAAELRYSDPKLGVEHTATELVLARFPDGPLPLSAESLEPTALELRQLENEAEEGASFLELPAAASRAKSYDALAKQVASLLAQSRSLSLWKSPSQGQVSAPGEAEGAFRARLGLASREQRDQRAAALEKKYAPKLASLTERIRRAEERVERERAQAAQQNVQTAISFGTTLLGAFLGRKAVSMGTVGRAATAARGVSRSLKEAGDVGRATESVEALRAQEAELDQAFRAELEDAERAADPRLEKLVEVTVRTTKARVTIKLAALGWAPEWIAQD